jgi:prepilin-type N-terminal cleavage/methylation domain-containing protein
VEVTRVKTIRSSSQVNRQRADRQHGFTILEILVAMALFAVVVLAVLAPLTGLFGLTQRSTNQVNAVNAGQQIIEQIRGQWLDTARIRYDKACVDSALPTAGAPTVTIQNENLSGGAIGAPFALNVAADCLTTPAAATVSAGAPPLRKVTVVTTANGTSATLAVEVAR